MIRSVPCLDSWFFSSVWFRDFIISLYIKKNLQKIGSGPQFYECCIVDGDLYCTVIAFPIITIIIIIIEQMVQNSLLNAPIEIQKIHNIECGSNSLVARF